VLTGMVERAEESAPHSKRRLMDDRLNIFVYMTRHGGNESLKFQGNEDMSALARGRSPRLVSQTAEQRTHHRLFR
jgi:glycosylphosphatidylinositol transamidase (GPIT) subunit GPI8